MHIPVCFKKKTKQNKTKQNKTKKNKTKQNKTKKEKFQTRCCVKNEKNFYFVQIFNMHAYKQVSQSEEFQGDELREKREAEREGEGQGQGQGQQSKQEQEK